MIKLNLKEKTRIEFRQRAKKQGLSDEEFMQKLLKKKKRSKNDDTK